MYFHILKQWLALSGKSTEQSLELFILLIWTILFCVMDLNLSYTDKSTMHSFFSEYFNLAEAQW